MKTLTLITGLLFILCLGLALGGLRSQIAISRLQHQLDYYHNDYIPTPPELQTKLKGQGYYDDKIDADIGTKTKEGWGRWYGDVSAKRYITKSGAPRK